MYQATSQAARQAAAPVTFRIIVVSSEDEARRLADQPIKLRAPV
jgi:hypothetical protein